MAVVTCNSVIAKCTFIVGSQSRGCSLQLNVDGSNITHNIERVNSSNYVQEEIVLSNIGIAVKEVFAFDWESDKSIGNVRIPVDITYNCSNLRPTSPTSDVPDSG